MAFHHLDTVQRNLFDFFFILLEDNIPLQNGSRVIDMDNRLLRPLYSLKSPLQKFFSALYKHLYRNVLRNHLPLNQIAKVVILNL